MPLSILRLTGARLTNPRALALYACVCVAASALAAFGPANSSASGGSESERRETYSAGGAEGADSCAATPATPASGGARARSLETYGRLPMRFEANRGQAGGGVRFLSRGSGYTLFLTGGGAVLRLRGAAEEE